MDKLGRATFDHIDPIEGVCPTNREIQWLKHIERHGPQSSVYLHELTKQTHRCKDTALRQMRKLRAGGFLMLPIQQRQTAHADFNPYVYDLTAKAKSYLFDRGHAEVTHRPTGHWWHGFTTSCVSSSIDISAAQNDIRYIPAHEILSRTNAPVSVPIDQVKLTPDQLFALDYGDGFRAFVLEVDRGSEPKNSPTARKSYARSIGLYEQMIERQLYKNHYGLKANLLVLWVFSSRTNEAAFLKMLERSSNKVCQSILTQACQMDGLASKLYTDFFTKDWHRCGFNPVRLAHP